MSEEILRDGDIVDRLIAEHRCEGCTGRMVETVPDVEEPAPEPFWPAFLVLVICVIAFVGWMFIWAAAQP